MIREKSITITWTLASAEARAKASASFKIPSRAKREDLRVGDLAKLVFVDPTKEEGTASGERMWVEIVSVQADRYRGRLRNTPVLIRDLEEDASIEFGPEHVADWTEGEAR